ncbi:Hint domain-containing protein [Roseobacter sinensis]|uniref:Hint domain-containing protein n=1 Tax=Roseobacter sinensis TaxID=2931391 RepID=UPI002981C1DD|nr:Hint domain-containing protein [Roseobacter sp. WL0113]
MTDGAQSYSVMLLETGSASAPYLMFQDELPPRGTDLWVMRQSGQAAHTDVRHSGDKAIICFTPGTRLATLSGQRRVEQLRIGDLVLTQDNGPQPVQWIGRRHMSEARLFAEPAFRPVRIRAGALGVDRPDQELLVSPQHRMLVSSDAARDLFDTTDVLVAAKDLIDGRAITVDLAVREVTYIHVLLPGHNILWANGVPTESFHPASASLHLLTAEDRSALLAALPGLAGGADCYGGYARRNLTKAEAAVLRHAA